MLLLEFQLSSLASIVLPVSSYIILSLYVANCMAVHDHRDDHDVVVREEARGERREREARGGGKRGNGRLSILLCLY